MPMLSVTPGAIRYDQETPLEKVLKGLQIAETGFKIPVAYEAINKAIADSKAAGGNADKAVADATTAKNTADYSTELTKQKLAYGRGEAPGALLAEEKGYLTNEAAPKPQADAAPAPGNWHAPLKPGNVATPMGSSDFGPVAALAAKNGSASPSALGSVAAQQLPLGLVKLADGRTAMNPTLIAQGLDIKKKEAEATIAGLDAKNKPTAIANENAKIPLEEREKFNKAIEPLNEQWSAGQTALTELSDPNGVVSAASREALLGMSDEISRKSPEIAKEITEQLGGKGKLTDWLSQKLTGQLDDNTKQAIQRLVEIKQAAIKDQASSIIERMASQAALPLRKTPEQIKNDVYQVNSLFPSGQNSQKIITENQGAGQAIAGNGAKQVSRPASGASPKTNPIHKQVIQNGHTYNWNPQTKNYE